METTQEIKNRYKNLTCDSLGCGNNLDSAGIKKGEKVLDLGCGSGRDCIAAAKIVGSTGKVTGLDLTPEMVIKARARIAEEKVDNVNFINGTIEALPLHDQSFDVVLSNCVINHSRDKTKVYREIWRVLKPGGRFVVSDAVSKEPLPQGVKNDPEAWAQCYGGAVTAEEYLSLIKAAGFDEVQILHKREYLKNGFDFVSLTLLGLKNKEV